MDSYIEVSFLNENKELIFKCSISSLPVKEDGVIKKSIELFNDSEPCIIHRSFVVKKIRMEIEEYLKGASGNKSICLTMEELSDDIRGLLEVDSSCRSLIVEQQL